MLLSLLAFQVQFSGLGLVGIRKECTYSYFYVHALNFPINHCTIGGSALHTPTVLWSIFEPPFQGFKGFGGLKLTSKVVKLQRC